MTEITGEAQAHGGTVSVEVFPGGALSSVMLTAPALELGARALAAAIVESVAEATARANQRTRGALRDALTGGVDHPADLEGTVGDLLDASAVYGLFDRLAAITATATSREHGIAATVNLDGRLIDLDLAPHALSLPAAHLAAKIVALTQQASATALGEGVAVLAPVAGEELTTELTEPLATPLAAEQPLDDFPTTEPWALPR